MITSENGLEYSVADSALERESRSKLHLEFGSLRVNQAGISGEVSGMNRFWRIQKEFGILALLRTLVLLVGLAGMAMFDYVALGSNRAALIAVVGLSAGSMLREKIAQGAEHYPRIITVGLFIYPIILFLGEQLGLDDSRKLAIITLTTVLIFDLQFWSLSDSSVVNVERNIQEK